MTKTLTMFIYNDKITVKGTGIPVREAGFFFVCFYYGEEYEYPGKGILGLRNVRIHIDILCSYSYVNKSKF